MKTVRLYGHLGVRFGRVFRLDVASPAEAVRALLLQLPGFRDAILSSEGAGGYLQTREEAYKVIQNMASIFRGIAWWQAGSIMVSADKPTDPSMLFTAANVIDGKFSYSGSARKARHTVALVSWNDPDDQYRQKIEYVEEETGIVLYGVRETEVLAFGCTSRGQAHRFGKWLLWSEINETETETHGAGLDGVYLAPGAVYQTQDASRAGQRFGGRLTAPTPARSPPRAGAISPPTTPQSACGKPASHPSESRYSGGCWPTLIVVV